MKGHVGIAVAALLWVITAGGIALAFPIAAFNHHVVIRINDISN